MNKYTVEYEVNDNTYYMDIESENESLVPFMCISKASKKHEVNPDDVFLVSIEYK